MGMSNFKGGFNHGVTIRGVPVLSSHGGNVYWVDSGSGLTGDGTFTRPFATIDTAINNCTANNGDIICVKPGHAETLSTASAITCDIAGVSVIGFGSGADRPTLTFSNTAATVVISAASVTWQNIVVKPSVDAVVSPFVVSAADCWLDVEAQDASAAIEFERIVLTTASADRLHADIKHRGFIAGNACVNSVRLVGCDTADINVDFYGVASTAVVEFHTTACHNIKIGGTIYNSGTTDGSKTVVDTVTGSTWSAEVFDATAGAPFSGGSGSALAKDDMTAVTDALYGTAGIATYPAAAAPGNNVSIAEVLRDVWDALRNGTGGTEPSTNKSIVDAIGFDGAAAVTASAGMVRTMAGTTFVVKKTLTSSAIVQGGVDVTGVSTVGNILIEGVHLMTDGTGLAAGTNFTLETNNTKGKAVFLTEGVAQLGASATIATSHANAGLADAGSFAPVLETGKKVIAKCTVADCTGAGTVDVYLICRRLADNATLSAA